MENEDCKLETFGKQFFRPWLRFTTEITILQPPFLSYQPQGSGLPDSIAHHLSFWKGRCLFLTWEGDHERGVILKALMETVNLGNSLNTALFLLLWEDLILQKIPGTRVNTLLPSVCASSIGSWLFWSISLHNQVISRALCPMIKDS